MLEEIGAGDVPQMLVFNKIDALPDGQQPVAASDVYDLDGQPVPRVFVSARSGTGLAALRERLSAELAARSTAMPLGDSPELHDTPA